MGSHRNPIPEKLQGRITKFFVSNLPDKCSGKDLAEFTRPLGEIYDLYVARKRDKFGNRFGFISFLDVKDADNMAKLLSRVKMGDYGLKANIARFVYEDGEIGTKPPVNQKSGNTGRHEGSMGEGNNGEARQSPKFAPGVDLFKRH